MLTQKHLYVKKSPIHGIGVFTSVNIKQGEVIEECYGIVTHGGDKLLRDYYFGPTDENKVVLTGFGLLYNHSDEPNATYKFDEINRIMRFKAKRYIYANEEVFISYGKSWFDDRRMPVQRMPFWRKAARFWLNAPLRGLIVCCVLFLLAKLIINYLTRV
ncbi:MAG: SET domain-containing protein-lysine N-methyltransferase [Gammaproteobacteria bacterium]